MSASEQPHTGSRLVGVLGGMGPRATVDFYDKLVAHTPADTDQEHLRVVIWADPSVPSRQAAILADGTDPSPWLQEGIDRLVTAGAELIVMPCNTAHAFVEGLVPEGVQFLSIVQVTVNAVAARPAGPVGLLATDAALAADLFQSSLHALGRQVLIPPPAAQARLTSLITQVKAGTADRSTEEQLREIIAELDARGATVTIAGCTEISVLLGNTPHDLPHDLVDPARELALATVAHALRPAPISGAVTP
ncbi:aspartate/glutamate racemase family protein [Flexivirga lutea]